MTVILTPEAQANFHALPAIMQARVLGVLERLASWPSVSGAKALRGRWVGHFRIRTGDWRVVFRVITPKIIIVTIAHRSKVYEG